jgi:hypothetical protein
MHSIQLSTCLLCAALSVACLGAASIAKKALATVRVTAGLYDIGSFASKVEVQSRVSCCAADLIVNGISFNLSAFQLVEAHRTQSRQFTKPCSCALALICCWCSCYG